MNQANRTLWNKLWYDSSGKLSLIELPNIPLLLAGLFWIASLLGAHTKLATTFSNLEFGFLFVWSWLEITTGKSYFRKILGAIVLVAIIYGRA